LRDCVTKGKMVNPVRNSSGALNPVRDLSLNGINPAGIILKSDNHIKGTSEHTKRMDLMICLGKKPNPTQEVPYETIIRGFRSAWQQQFVRNH
jgi:hypothetical protein